MLILLLVTSALQRGEAQKHYSMLINFVNRLINIVNEIGGIFLGVFLRLDLNGSSPKVVDDIY